MIGKDKHVVTVFPDTNKKYLSTDLLKQEPIKDDFLSKDIELLSFRAFKRVCHTCCNPDECVENGCVEVQEDGALPPCTRRG